MKNEEMQMVLSQSLGFSAPHIPTVMGMRWAGVPTDDDFARVDGLRRLVSGMEPWLEGDVICEFVRREKFKRERAGVRELCWEYAKGRSLGLDGAYERYCVSCFYPFENRVKGLTWSHHRIVWGSAACRPLHRALGWLNRVLAGQWTPEQLRAELRAAGAPASSTEPHLNGFLPRELQAAEDWTSGQLQRLPEITPDESRRYLDSLHCTIEFIDGLRAKLAAKV
jgi:hypothetical protein